PHLPPCMLQEDLVERGVCERDLMDGDLLRVESAQDLEERRAPVRRVGAHALVEDRCAAHAGDRPRDLESPIPTLLERLVAGLPSATILPRSIIAMLWQSWSASSMYWVVRKIVIFSSRWRRRRYSHTAARVCGSRPVVGSSRNRTRGWCTSPAPRSSLRRIPPEYVYARRSAASFNCKTSRSSSTRSSTSELGM